ncbi:MULTISPECIES: sensor histidine kinase [unclassified Nocardioides]|uniref:sensor histidine kinase n=1 Tax=unclassified Nocardioides TaxID=2615069 RepID=UPI003014F008
MARSGARVAAGAWVLAVLLLVALPLLATDEDGIPSFEHAAWWATLGVVTAASAALVVRRRRPAAVALATAAAVPAAAALGAAGAIGVTSVAFLVGLYTLATTRPWQDGWSVLTAAGLLVAAGQAGAAIDDGVTPGTAVGAGALQALVLTGGTLLVAALVVARRETRTAQDDRIRALEREQDALVQAAVARERTAMARELHDIAAHHLTGIAVLSAAIATQVDTDPAGAKAAVAEVRRESTAVLRDLRRLVGLLREDDGVAAGVRTETLAGLTGLVEQARVAGQQVDLELRADPDREMGTGVGPLAQLATYRMVQEALANAARHAPGAPCTVTVDDRDAAALVVTVTNGPAPRPADPGVRGGLGLVGMRERAELTGSTVEAGTTSAGGWRVRLWTPRAEGDA